MKKKLIILGIRGIPAAHGGFETFAERLAIYLQNRGWDVTVYCQGSNSGRREEDVWEGIKRVHIPVAQNGALGTIEFDLKSTRDVLSVPGLILTLGYNTGFLSAWLRLRGRANLINMDGLEWKRAKYGFGARIYLWINERLAAWSGTHLIADHPLIAEHLSSRTHRHKITMIPYGGDHVESARTELLSSLAVQPGEYFTVIARPEPENSILEIVKAFSRKKRNTKLLVLGNYSHKNSYQSDVLNAASEDVIFPGAIYDKETLAALRLNNLAYVHGHQVGGTNPSLVEALATGSAVIAHDNPFNKWVAGDAAIYFATEDQCDRAFDTLMSVGDHRQKLKTESINRYFEGFTWDFVLNSYDNLLSRFA